jgi:acyl-CoA thioesterase
MTRPDSGRLQDLFQRDAVAQYLGVDLLALDAGYAVVRMDVKDQHRNLFGTVHGGVIFTLADIAFGLAGNAGGYPSVAIDATISYMKSVRNGVLFAEAREYASEDSVASYRVVVTTQDGEQVALFQGMAYRRSVRPHPHKE